MTQRKQLPEFSFTNFLKGFLFSDFGEAEGTLLKRFVSSKWHLSVQFRHLTQSALVTYKNVRQRCELI